MINNTKINYKRMEITKTILDSFALMICEDIVKFYQSKEGKMHLEGWIEKHPEFKK